MIKQRCTKPIRERAVMIFSMDIVFMPAIRNSLPKDILWIFADELADKKILDMPLCGTILLNKLDNAFGY